MEKEPKMWVFLSWGGSKREHGEVPGLGHNAALTFGALPKQKTPPRDGTGGSFTAQNQPVKFPWVPAEASGVLARVDAARS